MSHSPLRRTVALVLLCSPIWWTSDVALAQAVLQRPGGDSSAAAAPPPSSTTPSFPAPQLPPTEPQEERGLEAPPPLVPIDAPLDPSEYVCGPGDLLELSFWGLQNRRVRVPVDLEGRAFVPRIGFVVVAGKTLAETRALLSDAVARNYPRLSFDVALAAPRTFVVQVAAGVASPGPYRARATDRLSTVLALAGGTVPTASRRRIEIRRRDGTVKVADLVRYALDGDVANNPRLLDGDVVRVPFEEIAATIEGGVNRPGRYELVAAKDLAELVDIAGGLSSGATRQDAITLVRRTPEDRRVAEKVSFGADGSLPAVELRHDDVVRVPDLSDVQRFVRVRGAITGAAPPPPTGTVPDDPAASPRLPFVAGETVRGLLRRAGGPGPLADLESSYLLRGTQIVPVDLQAIVMRNDLATDVPVELGDTLVVPFKRSSVLVKGAVFTPGPYPYDPGRGIEHYIALAGGPTRLAASLSKVRLIRPDGTSQAFDKDVVVPAGSSVVVTERSFTPPEVVQIVISAASVLVSGVAVLLAARRP
jgi:protein involved in polysaccharide export with SLBB domain